MAEADGQVEVPLSDQEWRLKCEELAKAELEVQRREGELDEEAEEWKDRKKDLEASISAHRKVVIQLAREVDTRKALVNAQQELPIGDDAAKKEEPKPAGKKRGPKKEKDREPGEEG